MFQEHVDSGHDSPNIGRALLRRNAWLTLLGLVLLVCASAYFVRMQDSQEFYKSELGRIGVTHINTDPRLAYARELALRDPLLGIDGVDPTHLREATRELEAAQTSLANAQTGMDILRTHSLYPIKFLFALADAEEARHKFIEYPADETRRAYDVALLGAIAAGQSGAKRFNRELAHYAEELPSFRFFGLGGKVTAQSLLSTSGTTLTRFSEIADRYQTRSRCLAGHTSSCEVRSMDVSPPAPPFTKTGELPALGNEIDVLRDEAWSGQGSAPSTGRIIALTQSVCTGLLEPPHTFFVIPPDWQHTRDSLEYRPPPPLWRNDMTFYKPENTSGSTAQIIADNYGVEYLPIIPTQFYTCPDVLDLLGTVGALAAVADFAQTHPDIEATVVKTLQRDGGRLIREEDALTYVYDVWQKYPHAREDVIPLVNMWRQRSAGLDQLVLSIARIDLVGLDLQKKGLPYDVSASSLFLTHSAFPSLFLLSNETAGSTKGRLRDTAARILPLYLSKIELYSTLRSTVSRAELVKSQLGLLIFDNARRFEE